MLERQRGHRIVCHAWNGGQRLSCIHSMLGPSMSQPQNSAVSASAAKWRSVRPAPEPKSSTRLPSNVQPPGSMSTIWRLVCAPSSR